MANWRKWFLEEDEEDIFQEEEQKVTVSKNKENEDSDKAKRLDTELTNKEAYTQVDNEIDLEDEEILDEFDIDFEEELYENKKSSKEVGVFSKIKELFKSKKIMDSKEEEELFDDNFRSEDDDVEDYKTYLERQKREREEKNDKEQNQDEQEKQEGHRPTFFSRLKEKLFSVSDEEIEREELDTALDDLYQEEQEEFIEKELVEEQEDFVIAYHSDNLEKENKESKKISLENFEEDEVAEKVEGVSSDLETTLKKLGVANTELRDVDIFGDKSNRRAHPTLAAVRTKRLKQDYKIDNLEKEVILGRDNTALKEEVASVYRERQKEQEEVEQRESKHKEERQKLDSEFNKLERKEDKIEKDNPLYQQNKELDDIFENIEQKENQAKIKEVPEFEVREVQSDAERRERLKYTSVNDILGGNEELFEDDIDRVTKKVNVKDSNEEIVEEVETFRKDVYKKNIDKEIKEKTLLDELIESENIEFRTEKDATTKEIEELNSNLDYLRKEKNSIEIDEDKQNEVDLIEEVAKIEDIEVEQYEDIKDSKKDKLQGYSDYHLDETEIVELEEQNYLEETIDNVSIDTLLNDISISKKVSHSINDVDKFTEEKTVPYEIAEKRKEVIQYDSKNSKENIEEVEQVEVVEEKVGIEYTEKLYTDEVYSYFDNDRGSALGEYKTIDRGYRPVSREKIEKNQQILDAIFEKYSTNSNNARKTVVKNMIETNHITPNTRSVGKFKPTPVYSSIYGSGNRPETSKTETKKTVEKASDKLNTNIYKEIASQEETVWNIGTSKRVPKNKVKTKKTKK